MQRCYINVPVLLYFLTLAGRLMGMGEKDKLCIFFFTLFPLRANIDNWKSPQITTSRGQGLDENDVP